MKTEIYYFTGTGNSLIVARQLAEQTNGKLIPIASLFEKEAIKPEADIIGIVFPVFYVDIPVIVKKFAEKLVAINGKYIFAVCTYGGGAGNSWNSLSRIIRSRGGQLAGKYGVHMPQNAFSKPWENFPNIYRRCRKKLERVGRRILSKKKGILFRDILAYWLLMPVQMIAKPAFEKYLVQNSGSPDLTTEEQIHLLDKCLSVNEKCTGCGICSEVCPVSNIKIAVNKPVWLHRCENCLACYHWCPNKAVQGGITPPKGYSYRHPDIKITDIMNQKRTASNDRMVE